jgi:hypothetical protein
MVASRLWFARRSVPRFRLRTGRVGPRWIGQIGTRSIARVAGLGMGGQGVDRLVTSYFTPWTQRDTWLVVL